MGRRYHDEFSQFHDHEHWPGKALLWLRVVLWLVFLTGCVSTYTKSGGADRLMRKLALFGSVFLLAFPTMVAIADRMPEGRRHQVVDVGSVLLQTGALTYIAHLAFRGKSFFVDSTIRRVDDLPSAARERTTRGLKVAFD